MPTEQRKTDAHTQIQAPKHQMPANYVIKHTATHFNTLQHATTHPDWGRKRKNANPFRNRILCNTLHCNTLQHTATQCNKLNTAQQTWSGVEKERMLLGFVTEHPTSNYTATHCNTLQHTATHCNILQHAATHCNTLHHTAPHCNTPGLGSKKKECQ